MDIFAFYRRYQRPFESMLVVSLLLFVAYEMEMGKLFSPHINQDRYRDHGIILSLVEQTINKNRYASGYFFPPPNIILIHPFSKIDSDICFRAHLVLDAISFVATLYFWLAILDIGRKPERFIIVALGLVASLYYVTYELQIHNLNTIGLGLLSWQIYLLKRLSASGALFGLGVCLKPYGSALLLPWMAWKGQFRWCLAAAIGVLAIGLLLPAFWFGLADTARLYREWLDSVASTSAPGFVRASGESLRAGIAALLGGDPYDPMVGLATRAAELAWLAMLVVFFVSRRRSAVVFGLPMAAEVAALLMVPLPIGYQQASRCIVLLIAMLVIATAVLDRARDIRTRCALLVIMLPVATLPWVVPVPYGPAHCVVTLVVCALSLIGLSIASPAPGRAQGIVAHEAA